MALAGPEGAGEKEPHKFILVDVEKATHFQKEF